VQLKRLSGTLMLCLDPDIYISFRESWIETLRKLQYDKYGEYIRREIYPILTEGDRKLWNKSTISNKDLQEAIEEFMRA